MKVLRSSLTAVLSAIMRTWLSESMEHMTYVVKMNITARPLNKWDSPAQSFLGSPMYLLSLHSRRFQKLTQRELNWEGVQKKNLHVGNKTGREFFFPHPLPTSPSFFAHPRHAPLLPHFFAHIFILCLLKERKWLLRRLHLLWKLSTKTHFETGKTN